MKRLGALALSAVILSALAVSASAAYVAPVKDSANIK